MIREVDSMKATNVGASPSGGHDDAGAKILETSSPEGGDNPALAVQQLQDENMALRALLAQYQKREAASACDWDTMTWKEAEREEKRIYQESTSFKSSLSSDDSPEKSGAQVEDKDLKSKEPKSTGNTNTDIEKQEWKHTMEMPDPLPTGQSNLESQPGAHPSGIVLTGAREGREQTVAFSDIENQEWYHTMEMPDPLPSGQSNVESQPGAHHARRFVLPPGARPQRREPTVAQGSPPEDTERSTSQVEPHAIPVEHEQIHDEAKPVDLSQVHQQRKTDKHRFLLGFSICLVLLAVFAGVLGGVLASRNQGSNTTDIAKEADATSFAPSGAPSEAPTGALDQLLLSLPESTVEMMNNDSSSSQWKAQDWLQGHPEISGMSEGRKLQLFALATFFYAMEGPDWRDDIRKRWLQYSDECYWFSTGFGMFSFATGEYVEDNRYKMDPCNSEKEFQLLDLAGLELGGKSPHIPPEISLLTSLEVLALSGNRINVSLAEFLPPQLYEMPNITLVNLEKNDFTGQIPSQLGLMTSMTELLLNANRLTGQLPTELFSLPKLSRVKLYINYLSGTIPSEVGLNTGIQILMSFANLLSGTIPTELGLLSELVGSSFDNNLLTGTIPTEVGSFANIVRFWLNSNALTGTIPSQLSLPPNLQFLWLNDNDLTGTVPMEMKDMVANGTLAMMELHDNNLQGSIPEDLCSLGLSDLTFPWDGISFDCTDQLCGCCWCPCSGSKISDNCSWALPAMAYDPALEDEDWPGLFPTPMNTSNVVTINIHTDRFPEETTWDWSRQNETGVWTLEDSKTPQGKTSLYSYTKHVESNTMYRLSVSDRSGDGTCCNYGFGWFSITNAIPSADHETGAVVWNATGEEFEESLVAFVWVDSVGNSHLMEGS